MPTRQTGKRNLSNPVRHISFDPPHEEALAKDWTLSERDSQYLAQYRKANRLRLAIQLCALRLYGRFMADTQNLALQVLNYLAQQLHLTALPVDSKPLREATWIAQQQQLLQYLNFRRLTVTDKKVLRTWIQQQILGGLQPPAIVPLAEQYLLEQKIVLPGAIVLQRQIAKYYKQYQQQLFDTIARQLSEPVKVALEQLLVTPAGEPYSFFAKLKEYPPHANPHSINDYLSRYQQLCQMNLQLMDLSSLTPKLLDYYFELAKSYHADDLKRFASPKRYTLLVCFIIETRKILLDYVIELHDQFITGLWRRAKHSFEIRFQEYRQRAKKANDILLASMDFILDRASEQPITLMQLYQQVNESVLKQAIQDCYTYKRLEEKGLAEALCARYTTLRRYFPAFVQLPFATDTDHKTLLKAITLIRQLDAGRLKKIPKNAPCSFIAKALEPALKNTDNDIHRPLWEISLAMAMRDALRAGDLYLAESKQHISFWKLIYPQEHWHKARTQAYAELRLESANTALQSLIQTFKETVNTAQKQFERDDFATIVNGRLQLAKDDKLAIPESVEPLQKLIEFNLPKIRIEKLLMEVDQTTQFSHCFTAQPQQSIRSPDFYRTLIAAIIAQATNLGAVTMANSVPNMTVSQLRHMMDYYVRESTLKAANARIVNHHHQLPLSAIYGQGHLSSSDAQRFGIIASSLMGSFYPRYFGYYEKAVGIYTHVSDQYSVYSTKVISCSPREALYVLDGLLENNTVLHPLEHTTDTAGYTEHVFALCYLLGFYYMPRIRDLKDQQLYKLNREDEVGLFAALMRKTVDLKSVEEQWDAMVRVAASLKHRLTPAHVILQRLARRGSSDRLTKAFTALGRLIKTLYILRYLTEPALRRRVQMQLNRGEYRHKLSRWLFFANQGEFQIGDYVEIMNKASCLSLVSNAILYWNTPKISAVITKQRQLGEMIEDATLARISPLAYKHVIPNGTYFIENINKY